MLNRVSEVVAGNEKGGYGDFESAQAKITAVKNIAYKPIPINQKIYKKLYSLYKQLHDAFASNDESRNLSSL